jgi:hypothetical protein
MLNVEKSKVAYRTPKVANRTVESLLKSVNEVQVVQALFMCLFIFLLFIPLKQNKNEEETIFSSGAFSAESNRL